MLRLLGWLLAATIPLGCAAPATVTEVAAGSAPPPLQRVSAPPQTPPPASLASEALAPSRSPSSAPSASPSPKPAATLAIHWKAGDPTGIGDVTSIVGVAHGVGGYVLVGELPYVGKSAAYWSRDGKDWDLAQLFPADVRILALTAGGPGFVAAGSANTAANVWTSPDGRSWQPVGDASLANGDIRYLVPTAGGIV